jgi:hypothetical protein
MQSISNLFVGCRAKKLAGKDAKNIKSFPAFFAKEVEYFVI